MIKCEICGEIFKNNFGGQLTNHLKEVHNINMEEYVILTEYNNIPPKCHCGYCNERPFFHRGKFSKYSKGHDEYKWLENKYIEKFDKPRCKYCDKEIGFKRGKPNSFCSSTCANNYVGGYWNQEQVKKTVNKKYGVENVFQLESIKNKIRETELIKYGVSHHTKTKEFIEKCKETSRKNMGKISRCSQR